MNLDGRRLISMYFGLLPNNAFYSFLYEDEINPELNMVFPGYVWPFTQLSHCWQVVEFGWLSV